MQRARRLWLNLHLCVGLALGGVFVLLGLTGSLLVFYPEIDRALNPALRPALTLAASEAPQPASSISVQAVADRVRGLYPEREGGWRIELPLNAHTPVTVRYARASEREGRSFSPLMVTLDPVTLAPTSERIWGDYLVTFLYDLHYTLLLDQSGKVAVGVLGLVMLLSLLSGLRLWWPSRARWRAALRPVIRDSAVRRVYDLHALGGAYGALFLLVLALSGAGLALPEQTRRLLGSVATLEAAPEVPTYASQSGECLSLDAIAAIARRRFPNAELRWVEVPGVDQGPVSVRLHQPGEPGRRFPKTRLWLDPETGELLAVWDPARNASGNTVLDWLHPLHNGEAFGQAGRWLTVVAGLLPLLLFVTGLIRWRQKRRAKATQRTRAAQEAGVQK